jgi:hypothetical protein
MVTSHYTEEQAQLERERDDLQEQIRRTLDREAVVAQRERAVVQREKLVIERELVMEERSKAARDVINHAKATMGLIEEQQANLQEWELAVVQEKVNLAAYRVLLATRAQGLKERETALQEREAKMEELLAKRSARIDRVVRWVGEVNPTLDTLGLSPILVVEAPPSLGAVLPVLDSAAEQLQRLESTILDCLEAEGRAVARAMAEYILTYLRSHDPAAPLTPVLVGPVRETAAAAREGVQEAADIMVSRIERHPGPGPASGRDPSRPPEK